MPTENLLFLRLRFLQELSDEQIDLIEGLETVTRHLGAGENLLERNSSSYYGGYLVEGWAGRSEVWRDGTRSISGLYLPGDLFSFESYLSPPVRQTIVTITGCKVRLIRRKSLDESVMRDPSLMKLFLNASIDNSIVSQWVSAARALHATKRLAHLICELYFRLGAVHLTNGGAFDFPLTQPAIADILGLSLVHVNRIIKALRETGTLTWERSRIVIHDLDKLTSLCDFDPSYLRFPRSNGSWEKLEPRSKEPSGAKRQWVDALLQIEKNLGLMDEIDMAVSSFQDVLQGSRELLG